MKNLINNRGKSTRLLKFSLKMKLTTFLLVVTLFNVSASNYAQNTKISLNLEDVTVKKVLAKIESSTDFKFLFNRRDIDLKSIVSIKVDKESVKSILDNMFIESSISYDILDKQIILKPALIDNTTIEEPTAEIQETEIKGVVSDADGSPLPGVSIVIDGTTTGTETDFDGEYTITASKGDILAFSFIGMKTQKVTIGDNLTIDVSLEDDAGNLDEVVVVGYGTQKKINLTGAVSVVGEEDIANRPVASAMNALQGISPGLVITTNGDAGQPGAKMDINIRGLTSLEGSSAPYVLVDGIPMDITDIDPEDIASISILKDAASAAIYGARAAFGVILVTTKKGKAGNVSVNYSNNFAMTDAVNMPRKTDAVSYAHLINQSQFNQSGSKYYTDEQFADIEANYANPGSAPEMYRNGNSWRTGAFGLRNTAAYDWDDLIFKDYGSRMKHNLSFSGGTEKLSFYLSGGMYEEQGIIKPADDGFERYNVSATINAEINDWLSMSFLTKYRSSNSEYPTVGYDESGNNRSALINWIQRIKPTAAKYWPGTELYTTDNRVDNIMNNKVNELDRQLIVAPRLIIEPIKDWVTTIELNYTTNDNNHNYQSFRFPTARPKADGSYDSDIIAPATQGNVTLQLFTNRYISPRVNSEYSKSFAKHNFSITAGYQEETYNSTNLRGDGVDLLTENIAAIRTALGNNTVRDDLENWSTQGYYGRFKYNYDEKYLLEVSGRYDGTSKFADGDRWGFFPSMSAGWVVSKENFFPFKDLINRFKLRGSYGTIGNQNVASYLYLPGLGINQSRYLFTDQGSQPWQVTIPNQASVDLSWETVTTTDIGFNAQLLNNRLGITFDWYESVTSDLVSPGPQLPSVLGAGLPKKNEGEVTTKGWEVEASWKNSTNDFSYGARVVLSDYVSTVTKFNNPAKLIPNINASGDISGYYVGMELGEIWGMETEGLFQTQAEIDGWHDQLQVSSSSYPFKPGDVKYVDQNGDGIINQGENTRDAPGDRVILGNSSPRFHFGISGNVEWKGLDMSFLIQGIASRKVDVRNFGTFRGAANGPLHISVYGEHMDYWRDDSSPLGANPNAYFPNSYLTYDGRNQKNFRYVTDRYLQDAAYIRLKNLQIGYTIPKNISEKALISRARIYLSGENLWTATDLMFFDPEAFQGNNSRVGSQYPLSTIYSLGLNINF